MEIAFLSGRANSRETKNKARSRFSSLVERKRKSGTIVVEYFLSYGNRSKVVFTRRMQVKLANMIDFDIKL